MLAWMSYVIVVSLLLSLAAFALEHSARIRQKPTRWLWGTSMTASLLVPLIVSSVSVQIPQLGGVAAGARHNRKRTIAIRLADGDCRITLGVSRSRPTVAGWLERRVGDPAAGNRGQQRATESAPTSLEARQHG
jgi:hypothetical protein